MNEELILSGRLETKIVQMWLIILNAPIFSSIYYLIIASSCEFALYCVRTSTYFTEHPFFGKSSLRSIQSVSIRETAVKNLNFILFLLEKE